MSENNIPQTDGEITIADLYPDLTPEQQSEAEYHLLRYLAVVRTIFEQISKENPELLTKLKRLAMLRKIRGDSRDSSP